MAKSYFISDVHIGVGTDAEEKEKLIELKSFFNYINQPDNELYIVGDLFDYWFEYKYVVPSVHYQWLFEISRLIDGGVKVHFLPGNHDCWLRDFLEKQIKINIHPETYTTDIHSKRVFLFHGDGILKKDGGYRLLKKILRNPINVFLYSLIHPDIGVPVMKFMSSSSRDHVSKRVFKDNKDEYIDFASGKFSQGIDCVVFGHTHQPFIEKIGDKTIMNLGDWIKKRSYGLIDDDGVSLNYWNS